MLPFFTNYKYNLIIKEPCSGEFLAITTVKNVKRFRGLHEQLKKDAEFINLTIRYYYNKRHKDVPSEQKGNKIYLQRKTI